MRKIIILSVISFCISNLQAQFLKKLKDKVNQSAKNVTTKVKVKAETAPDRIIDHAATKVDTKAETKIDNKENKANSKIDKTVDKVDSIKLKKQKTEVAKDSVSGTTYRNELQQKILQLNNPLLVSPAIMTNKLYMFFNGKSEQLLNSLKQI